MDDVRLVRRVGLVCGLIVLSSGAVLADGRVSFSVDSWAEKWGNHRVRLQVDQAHDAVRAHVPWRRRDPAPQTRGIAILHADSGKPVTNVAAITIAREHGDIVFQPAQGSGRYDLYTMPYTASKVPHQFATRYKKPGSKADPAWLKKHSLTPDRLPHGKWKNLPATTVLEIQARSERDRFDPMEVIATAEETDALLARHKDSSYLLFPEDRSRPIRMTDDLPLCWIDRGPSNAFRGQAKRGEFYTFQIGVFAAAKPIQNLTVTMSDLRSEAGAAIPASRLRCFNAGGTDWLGRPIRKTISVAKGKVQPLWFGLDVPPDAPVGTYRGSVTLRPERGNETNVSLSLTVSADVLADAGDSDPHRLARLRWLDSTVGLDDKVVAPFTPMVVKGQTVRCLGRRVQIADTGLPAGIQSLFAENVDRITDQGLELLAGPMAMIVETAGGKIAWTGQEPIIVSKATGAVVWESTSRGGGLTMRCRAKMEADGYANYRVTLRADQATNVNDIRLEIPLRRQVATYMMGMGCKGGHRPEKWDWKWDVNRANNSLWIGAVNAGLHCKLKGPRDTWNLYNLADGGVPQSWDNNGRGRCTVRQENPDTVVIRASTGQRTLQAGQQLAFRFGLLITPIKPLNPDHWNQRYYHAYVPVKTVQKAGAKIVNIHHGNELNPFINYPFLTTEKLKAYVDNAHANDIKVKIYYTVRELSNYVAELWPLRSLGREIFADGAGGGHAWLHEHLVTHYAPAWHHVLPDGQVDASIATVGLSRWHNYYLEGLAWLVRNVGIDGLYLDGIGYDREIMKRVRKVLDRNRPGCLIDFHSGNNFHPTYGLSNCANQYMEHLPYIDSLWFGEGYDYNESPDYWLVENFRHSVRPVRRNAPGRRKFLARHDLRYDRTLLPRRRPRPHLENLGRVRHPRRSDARLLVTKPSRQNRPQRRPPHRLLQTRKNPAVAGQLGTQTSAHPPDHRLESAGTESRQGQTLCPTDQRLSARSTVQTDRRDPRSPRPRLAAHARRVRPRHPRHPRRPRLPHRSQKTPRTAIHRTATRPTLDNASVQTHRHAPDPYQRRPDHPIRRQQQCLH